jgi:sugar lactone lactonase YvrE
MYYIDTPTRQVMAFEFDAATGTITNGRVVIEFPEDAGVPDGMTVDRDGLLWIAHWDGGRVTRWDPATGKQVATIHVPADRVTSCAFGGAEWDTLFITPARQGLTSDSLDRQPTAGGIFAARTGAQGQPSRKYAG